MANGEDTLAEYPSDDEIVAALTEAGLPPDRELGGTPQWFNDYGGGSLMDAFRAGYRYALGNAHDED